MFIKTESGGYKYIFWSIDCFAVGLKTSELGDQDKFTLVTIVKVKSLAAKDQRSEVKSQK